MRDENILLRVSGLCKSFPVGKERLRAVSDVSFALGRGECLGIVGESGCGKSTLARVIIGATSPTSGTIELEGRDITALKGRERRAFQRNIQMVFQDPLSSFSPRMKIGVYITESLRNYEGLSRGKREAKAAELLEMVGLPADFSERFPHELSGGQLQRVAIARAIAIQPALLICDEATGALDVSIQNQVAQMLVDLIETRNIGCLFIGHDLALVRSVSQRIAVMYLGRIVELLESETLSQKAAHPYTRALLDAIFDVYCDQSQPVRRLTGEPPSPLKLHEGCAFADRCARCLDVCRTTAPLFAERAPAHWIACHNPYETNEVKD